MANLSFKKSLKHLKVKDILELFQEPYVLPFQLQRLHRKIRIRKLELAVRKLNLKRSF